MTLSAAASPLPLDRRRCLALGAAALALGLRPAAASLPREDMIGEVTYLVTDGNETLLDIARVRGLGVPEISAVNPGVDPWVPAAETLLTLPTAHLLPDAPHTGIVINIPEMRLFWFPKGAPVETYPIGIGREEFTTPIGSTKIVRKQKDPVWRPTADARRTNPDLPEMVPAGPDNPMGEYAMYLGWPTYAIHGTNRPYAVGRRVSRGCIRMYPEAVESLFQRIPVGTKVTTVFQPVKVGWHQGELWIEVQPDLSQIDELEVSQTMSVVPAPDARDLVLKKAGPDADRIDWTAVDAELITRRGLPVQITRPRPPGSSSAVADGAAPVPPPAASAPGLDGIY